MLAFFTSHIDYIYMITFAIFLGFELIGKVPSVLHTPLMSGSNAISGIVVIGAIALLRQTPPDAYLNIILCASGIIFGSINIVGGFAVTNRMLAMFKKKK